MEDVELAGGGRGWRESEGTAWGGKLVNEDRSSFTADWNPKRKQVLPHQQIKRRYTVKPSGSGKKQTHTVDQTHTLTRECCLSRDICYQTIEIAYAQRPIHTQSQKRMYADQKGCPPKGASGLPCRRQDRRSGRETWLESCADPPSVCHILTPGCTDACAGARVRRVPLEPACMCVSSMFECLFIYSRVCVGSNSVLFHSTGPNSQRRYKFLRVFYDVHFLS